jgi:hypothetical protein
MNWLCLTLMLSFAFGCERAEEPAAMEPTPTGANAQDASSASAQLAAQETPKPEINDSPIRLTLCAEGLPDSGMWKCDPVFADVNGDGNIDLAAIPRLGEGPQVWFGDGDGNGNWTDSSNGLKRTDGKTCGGGVRLADVNNDSHLDLVVADHCAGVFIYLGDSAGNWNMVLEKMYPSDIVPEDGIVDKYRGAESIAVGDVNNDGNADLIVGGADEAGIRYYIGDGTGSGWSRLDNGLPEAGWCVRVELSDINRDGWLDVVAAYSAGPRVFLNEQGERFVDGSLGMPSPMMGGIFWGLAVADFNEDGLNDIAIANWVDGPEIYIQSTDGVWTKSPDVFEQMVGGAQGLAAGDLDQDGHLDLVVSGRMKMEGGMIRGVFALRGDGTGGGAWDYLAHSGLPETGLGGMAGVGLADINNDGWLDVAACTGLIVESVPNAPRKPTLPFNLLMWCSEPTPKAAASASED